MVQSYPEQAHSISTLQLNWLNSTYYTTLSIILILPTGCQSGEWTSCSCSMDIWDDEELGELMMFLEDVSSNKCICGY